jgi:hypothetical protein
MDQSNLRDGSDGDAPSKTRKQVPGGVTGRSWIVYAQCIHHSDSTSQQEKNL